MEGKFIESPYSKCQDCGKGCDDVDLYEVKCPIAEEMDRDEDEIIICEECYKERRLDI